MQRDSSTFSVHAGNFFPVLHFPNLKLQRTQRFTTVTGDWQGNLYQYYKRLHPA
jgi:hypothetical protein